MGQAISAIKDVLLSSDKQNKKELEEQLAFLVNSANDRLDKYQIELDEYVSSPLSSARINQFIFFAEGDS